MMQNTSSVPRDPRDFLHAMRDIFMNEKVQRCLVTSLRNVK